MDQIVDLLALIISCSHYVYFCRMNAFQENFRNVVPLKRRCVMVFRMLLARLQWTLVCQKVSCVSVSIMT